MEATANKARTSQGPQHLFTDSPDPNTYEVIVCKGYTKFQADVMPGSSLGVPQWPCITQRAQTEGGTGDSCGTYGLFQDQGSLWMSPAAWLLLQTVSTGVPAAAKI